MPDLKYDKHILVKTLLKIVAVMAVFSLVIILGITIYQTSSAYKKYGSLNLDSDKATFTQLDEPADNQEIAIVKTNMGEFRIALYREYAPNTVENFVNTVNSGYYTNTEVISGVSKRYFVGGKNESDGVSLEPEITENLWTFKGAVCAVTDDYGSSNVGNRLLFVGSIDFTEDMLKELDTITAKYGGKAIIDKFVENGGILNFAGTYSVFGQVYDGMDVYEKICNVENTDESGSEFKEKVIIESIEISRYEKGE